MDLRRLSQGERIATVSALLLLAFTFLDWYGFSVSVYGASFSYSGSAWDLLEVIPILLVVGIAGTLLMAMFKLAEEEVELAIDGPRIIAVLGAASFALILYRLIERPIIGSGSNSVEASPQVGIFLALLAAAGVAFGGWRAMREGDFWRSTAKRGPAGGDGDAGPVAGESAARR